MKLREQEAGFPPHTLFYPRTPGTYLLNSYMPGVAYIEIQQPEKDPGGLGGGGRGSPTGK